MERYISNFVYGGIDGVITTNAIISGSIGSNQSVSTVVILTVSSLIADALSMGFSSYESTIIQKYKLIVGLVTFISFIVLGSIPIIVYAVTKKKKMKYVITSMIFSLFMIGYIKGYMTERNALVSGFNTAVLGTITSAVAYYIANVLSKKFIRE